MCCSPSTIACEDNAVIVDEEDVNGETVVFARLNHLLEATITIDATLQNMHCNVPLPATRVITGTGRVPLLSFIRDQGPSKYSYRYHWQKGVADPKGVQPSYITSKRSRKYVSGAYVVCYLPFPRNRAYNLVQGPLGKISHYRGTQAENALDFDLQEGDTITAALPGVVIGARSDSISGGTDPRFLKCSNYIIVKHYDGTYGEYAHLRTNGVNVRVGQQVEAMQVLGLAGHTGQAAGPHLHFAVYKVRDGNEKVTLPVVFQTSAGILAPKEGDLLRNN